ncbi:MAG: cytidylate kinase-like family protein [Oscillospiraceae bacterium]|jgi:cytidylate kinase|nr:cytidylate kinase-like family protein [Oscillospiraceae bacterium]
MAEIRSNFVLAISRQYGSGGRGIGKKIADELGIGCYDKELITLTAEKSGLSQSYVENSEERVDNGFMSSMSFNAYHGFDSIGYYETPTTDKMFIAQSEVVREIAAQGACVIIGRCADYVLRHEPNLIRVFIRADTEDRIQRAIESYELPRKNAIKYVKKADKARSNYYRFYTNRTWGDPEHEDLIINSSYCGSAGVVELIKKFLQVKGYIA